MKRKLCIFKLYTVAQADNPSSFEAEGGGWRISGYSEPHREILSRTNKQKHKHTFLAFLFEN